MSQIAPSKASTCCEVDLLEVKQRPRVHRLTTVRGGVRAPSDREEAGGRLQRN